MSAQVTVTGNIGQQPTLKYTKNGTTCIDLNIGATPRRKPQNSDTWENIGDDLWIRATFWKEQAEHIDALNLPKGAKVTIQGTLTQRTYQARDGQNRVSLELHNPHLLGIIPPKPQHQQQGNNQQQGWDANPPF